MAQELAAGGSLSWWLQNALVVKEPSDSVGRVDTNTQRRPSNWSNWLTLFVTGVV